jgi:hypothetical protein
LSERRIARTKEGSFTRFEKPSKMECRASGKKKNKKKKIKIKAL